MNELLMRRANKLKVDVYLPDWATDDDFRAVVELVGAKEPEHALLTDEELCERLSQAGIDLHDLEP